MDPERLRKIEALYDAGLGVEPARRAAFLAENCAGDESLRREVESLLDHDENAGGFLEVPAAQLLPQAARLDSGARVSHYEIQEKLGEGGMGVVYKARDTRLGRSVALKFVKAQFSERFEREARAIASLNHPHIATLYEVGEHEGAPYLAMEFVEGQPLKGPRPVKEVIEYGIQLADALATAHAAGIVHRDLKPANILVTEKGSVKILDFGLAKLRAQARDGEPATATLTGVSAGTPGYMSPEQIDGKRADSRSDIFAFGCVLYELVSGRHAFGGDSLGAVLAATTLKEPEPLRGVPEKLDELIRRCLRKDPERRLQHIGDARIVLEELKEGSDSGTAEPVAASKPVWRWVWIAVALAVVLAAAGWLWFSRFRNAAPESPLTAVPLTSFPGIEVSASFSPDGDRVAFSWNGKKEDNYDIYVQEIGSGEPLRRTTDPALDSAPAWSPDGKQIAFLRQLSSSTRAVVLVPPLGGAERRLAELNIASDGMNAGNSTLAWHPGGRHLAVVDAGALFLLSTETGEKQRLTTKPQTLTHRNPAFSPDGQRLAFSQWGNFVADLYLLSLDDRIAPQGEPAQLTSGIGLAAFPVWTADGHEIVFSAGAGIVTSNLWRVAISGPGKPQRLASVGQGGSQPALSRDGRRLAYSRRAVDLNIWRIEVSAPDLAGRRPARHIASSLMDFQPEFSPDGSKIAFESNRAGTYEIWVCDSDGSNPVQVTTFGGPVTGAPNWSRDGQQIVFDSRPDGHADIFIVGAGGGKPRRLTKNPAQDVLPSWSLDGKWIYFSSNRTGRGEVWKMPAEPSASEQPIQVTRNGGGAPTEARDGFVYYAKAGGLWRVPVEGGEESRVLESVMPRSLQAADKGIYFIPSDEAAVRFLDFKTKAIRTVATLGQTGYGDLAVSPDGRTILYTQVDTSGSDLMLVENFR